MSRFLKKGFAVLITLTIVLIGVFAGRMDVYAKDYSSYSAQKVGWGLSRNGYETPAGSYPYPNFSMKEYSAYYVGDTNKKVMYFTFDCGYENGNTGKILDILKKKKIKAVFFVTKPFIVSSPELVKRMKEEGHLVGNHTVSHPSLPEKSIEQVKEEVKGVEKAMKEYTGYSLDKYIRPPMGEYSIRTLKILQDMGYRTIFWSLAWKDWDTSNQPDVESVVNQFERSYHNGMIPLIHNTSSADTNALPKIIAYMQSQGYHFERLDYYFRPTPKVSVKVKEILYNGKTPEIKVKTTSDGKVTYIFYNKNNKRIKEKPTDAGTYYVKVKVSATENYKASSAKVRFKINKAVPKVKISLPDLIYEGDDYQPVVTTKNTTGTVTIKYYNIKGKQVQKPYEAGVYYAEAYVAASNNYKKAHSSRIKFSILVREAANKWTLDETRKAMESSEEEVEITSSVKELKAGKSRFFKANQSGVVWTSSNPDIATVSPKGQVVTLRRGRTTITATKAGKKASVKLIVTPKKIIGVDAGHQKHAALGVFGGTIGTATGKPEYQLTLELALKLQEELENRGYQVVMTRTTNDVNISNQDRALQFNETCDIAIHIHGDGLEGLASGASAYYFGGKSKRLSETLLNAYCDETGLRNRGSLVGADLISLKYSNIPAVLLEMGFMTNRAEDIFMSSKSGQKKMVRGMANGIDNYFYGGSYGILISL